MGWVEGWAVSWVVGSLEDCAVDWVAAIWGGLGGWGGYGAGWGAAGLEDGWPGWAVPGWAVGWVAAVMLAVPARRLHVWHQQVGITCRTWPAPTGEPSDVQR